MAQESVSVMGKEMGEERRECVTGSHSRLKFPEAL